MTSNVTPRHGALGTFFRTAAIAAALVCALPASHDAVAHEFTAGPLKIDHPWARPSLGANKITAGYMKITNTGQTDDMLIAAKTPVATTVELHTHTNDNGVMRMRKLDGGIPLPAGETVTLKPGGLHLMLIGLTSEVKTGSRVPVELTFAKAGTITVEAAIEMKSSSGDADDASAHSHHGASHDHGTAHQHKTN
ncbi:MAG: copper chaperone PCu(A)C [Pseudomonadota bacterium]